MREWLRGLHDRLIYPQKADREAVQRSERLLRAFMEGDHEYQRAEMLRVYGANFFAAMAQSQELTDLIVRDKLITDTDEDEQR